VEQVILQQLLQVKVMQVVMEAQLHLLVEVAVVEDQVYRSKWFR
jgi:hypothetical protein